MKRDNVNYLLVGSFVLLMAAVLFYALYRITGHSAKGDVYFTYFPNVAGIKEGSVVTFEGFEVGNIAGVEPVARENRTWYRVTLNLRQRVRVPTDSRALIATPGLLAAPLVEIREGRSRDVLAPGGEIAAAPGGNLMESVATLAADLSQIAETGVKPLLAQISERVESLGGTLDQSVPDAMNKLRSTLSRLDSTAGRIEALFNDENRKHWGGLLRNADQASASALKLSRELHDVRAELDGLMKDSRGVVVGGGKEVQASLTEIRESLRRTNAVLYQLESAGRNLNEFSRHIRENPGSLIRNHPPVEATGEAQ